MSDPSSSYQASQNDMAAAAAHNDSDRDSVTSKLSALIQALALSEDGHAGESGSTDKIDSPAGVSPTTSRRTSEIRPAVTARRSSKSWRNSQIRPKSTTASLPTSPASAKVSFAPEVKVQKTPAPSIASTDQAEASSPSQAAAWIDAREGYQLMAMHLWRAFKRDSLFSGGDNDGTGEETANGVAIRYGKAQYVVCPSNDDRLADFCQSVAVLNCEAAMTLTSSVVAAITKRLAPTTLFVPITPSQHIQVVDTMAAVAGTRKAQNACFVRSEKTLVVWADQVEILRERAKDLEEKMVKFVWQSSYYGNSNNLMVASLAGGAPLTPALTSPSVSSPTSSAPPLTPASLSFSTTPTTPAFPTATSTGSLGTGSQGYFDKASRNHRRSYLKDVPGFGRANSLNSIDAGKARAMLADEIPDPPTSPKSALLRPQNTTAAERRVSFYNAAVAKSSEDPSLSAIQTSSAAQQQTTSTTPRLDASQLSSPRSSFTSADEKHHHHLHHHHHDDLNESNESIPSDVVDDPEKQQPEFEQRQMGYLAPLHHGFAVGVDILICFIFISSLFNHALRDGSWSRMALAPITIIMFPVIMFFCDNMIGIIIQLVGPINQLHQNSLYFSGKAPARKLTGDLPHITIQMPVYKESLQGVLMPTIESVKKAITTYELQGGTAGIVVSEDGMLLVDEQEQNIRKEFYERNNVGWVARPGHNVEGYIRKGRFKKASNLNFTCRLSMAVEEMMNKARPTTMAELEMFRADAESFVSTKAAQDVVVAQGEGEAALALPSLHPDEWSDADETELYRHCLESCLPQMHRLAQAKGNIRIGQLILMIDSDTRVPEDCLLDAATEMTQCPDVGVLQHCSGVMLVSDSYFEMAIAFFTRLVNFAISFTVANGDIAPFVGHNAFLRWSAMQEASFIDPEDGMRKMWSESHVSEDFDMALRLLMSGYITRWATYSNSEFQEGVSLTCDDELNRWQKYAFGCSELVMHRIWDWPFKGIFTPLFKTFLKSDAPIHYKFSACSYIFSYYAIGASFPTSIALYLVEGWCYPVLDPAFMTPFKIWVSVMVVFPLGGNVGQILARYRAKEGSLFRLIKEHMTWVPCMWAFFGGLSYHVATALVAHPLGIDMTWGATNKDLADSNFFLEVPLIWKRFWRVFLIGFSSIALVIILQLSFVPLNWEIVGFYTYWPLLLTATTHIIYPIVLNPALLRFSF